MNFNAFIVPYNLQHNLFHQSNDSEFSCLATSAMWVIYVSQKWVVLHNGPQHMVYVVGRGGGIGGILDDDTGVFCGARVTNVASHADEITTILIDHLFTYYEKLSIYWIF